MKKRNIRQLLLSIIVCQVAGLIGSLVTAGSLPVWYGALVKPSYNPPGSVFGLVWTAMYILMGISLYLIRKNRRAVNLFLLHLVVNTGWSVVFFGLRSIAGGMATLVFLWVFIVYLARYFYRINRTAAYLLIPYLVWVSFAGVLNFSILLLNR